MVNKFQNILDQTSAKIKEYNSKISSGIRLDQDQSDDFSKALKLYPLLLSHQSLLEDYQFATSDPSVFDDNFKSDMLKKVNESEKSIETMISELSKEEIKEFIIEIRAGAGGEEASLFSKDIFNAYTKYLSGKRYRFELIEESEGEAGGFSTVIFQVESQEAYELLKNEGGVHRVQRVPKTESSGRIHTSTISVAILPIHKKVNIVISPNDLIIDVYRSSGNGGQSVNTTDSAVRITHIPSGLVVTCQNTKSQIKNKEMALKVLAARLDEIQRLKSSKNIQDIRNQQILNSDRAEKIRTYNYLQDRITDHRVKLDFSNIPKFMQGDIEHVLSEINLKMNLENSID